MAHVRTGKARALLRSSPSGSFDQYLLDIQKLPMITDPEEEKRLARRALAGDEVAAERLVTANLRFVISYVKKYQGHGLDLSELVAIGNEGLLKAVRKFDPGPRREVHLLRGVVGAPGGAQGAGRADPQRPDPAQPELRAGAHGAGAELPRPGAGPRADRRRKSPSRSTTSVDNIRAARRMTAHRGLARRAGGAAGPRAPAPSASGSPATGRSRSRR